MPNVETFIAALKNIGTLTPLKEITKPTKKNHFTICFKNKYYDFKILPSLIDHTNLVNSIDSALLTNFILTPILGIQDLKTTDNIEFSAGNTPLLEIKDKLDSGKCELAFLLFPPTIEQVKQIADNGLYMPPKSTLLEPKLRSGLTIYNINE